MFGTCVQASLIILLLDLWQFGSAKDTFRLGIMGFIVAKGAKVKQRTYRRKHEREKRNFYEFVMHNRKPD